MTRRARALATTAGALLLLLLGAAQAAAAGPYSLLVSTSSTRANPVSLDGATVKGKIYVFTKPDTSDISRVRFWLDNSQHTGTPRKSETSAPYDFAGTSSDATRTAKPFDTATLTDGQHTITASVDLATGTSEIVNAAFTVANKAPATPALTFSPSSLSFSGVAGTAPVTKSASLSASTGSGLFSASESAGWLDVSPSSGSTPATLSLTADPANLAPGSYSTTVTASAPNYTSAALQVTLTVTPAPPPPCSGSDCGRTTVSIQGTKWLLNGSVTYPGRTVEGMLLNARTANAIADDANPETRTWWAYSDTGVWDPDRNTSEFVSQVPIYASKGLKAVTVGMQGANPIAYSDPRWAGQPWTISGYNADGSLKQSWMDRLERVLRATDDNGMVVILSLFYRFEDEDLADETAVKQAVDNVVDWLLAHPYRNVVIEVANESQSSGQWNHPILTTSRLPELMSRITSRSGGRLLVSGSLGPKGIPSDAWLAASDFVLLHANNQTVDTLKSMVDQLRAKPAYQAHPTPIVFNEDGRHVDHLDAAVAKGASWGYHDLGGFQVLPVDWRIKGTYKPPFFDAVFRYAFG
jgi:hypothetical protein